MLERCNSSMELQSHSGLGDPHTKGPANPDPVFDPILTQGRVNHAVHIVN